MKLLIVDDHSLVREGLRALLARLAPEFDCLEAWDTPSLEQLLNAHPDIALLLLDLQLPDRHGLDVLVEQRLRHPQRPVLMLSAEQDPQTVRRALDLGAAGFITKSSVNQILLSAIQLVLAGGRYVPPEALGIAPMPAPAAREGVAAVSLEELGLSARQVEVFRLLVQGLSNKQISRRIDIAEATVKIHVRGILRALNVTTRSEAMAKAVRLGLADSSTAGDTP